MRPSLWAPSPRATPGLCAPAMVPLIPACPATPCLKHPLPPHSQLLSSFMPHPLLGSRRSPPVECLGCGTPRPNLNRPTRGNGMSWREGAFLRRRPSPAAAPTGKKKCHVPLRRLDPGSFRSDSTSESPGVSPGYSDTRRRCALLQRSFLGSGVGPYVLHHLRGKAG